jgi:hypothetical protein
MDTGASKRRWTRLTVVLALALGSVISLSTAHPAASVGQHEEDEDCFATLILERVDILQDTDPNAVWPRVDQWTYHIYWMRPNGKLVARVQQWVFAGDTGYSRDWDTTADGDNIAASDVPIGHLGESVTLKLELWTKEKDPQNNRRGAWPADARNNKNPLLFTRSWVCERGEDRFSVIIDIPRSTADPQLAETDGKVEYHWLFRVT